MRRSVVRHVCSPRPTVIVAGALVAVLVPSAEAATKTVAKAAVSGPVLAGPKVLYGVGRRNQPGREDFGVDLRVVSASGGRPTTLYRFNSPDSQTFTNELIGLDADGSRWAAVRQAVELRGDGPDTIDLPQGADLVAGAIGKRPSRLLATFGKAPGDCSPRRYDEPGDVAVIDGGLAVEVEANACGNSAIALRLGKITVRLRGREPRGAGRWLAYINGTDVVVYDVNLRREAYRIREAGEMPVVLDPQDDGKVVIQWNRAGSEIQRLAWYSKAENRAHDLGVASNDLGSPPFESPVSMAADTIVVPLWSNTMGSARRRISAISLTGVRREVDEMRVAAPLVGVDFDGRRIAWIDGGRVRVAPLPQRAKDPIPSPSRRESPSAVGRLLPGTRCGDAGSPSPSRRRPLKVGGDLTCRFTGSSPTATTARRATARFEPRAQAARFPSAPSEEGQ